MNLPAVSLHAIDRFNEYVRMCSHDQTVRNLHYGFANGELLKENFNGMRFILATYHSPDGDKQIVLVARKNLGNDFERRPFLIATVEKYEHYLANISLKASKYTGPQPGKIFAKHQRIKQKIEQKKNREKEFSPKHRHPKYELEDKNWKEYL